jgi:hypothetical protein
MDQEFMKEIGGLLSRREIPYEILHGGKHPKFVFNINGKDINYTVPKTPSDRRGLMNAMSDIKRLLGPEEIQESVKATCVNSGILRVTLTKAQATRMFGHPDLSDKSVLVDMHYQEDDHTITLSPTKVGGRRPSPNPHPSNKPEGTVGYFTVGQGVVGLKISKRSREICSAIWLANNKLSFKLPGKWWARETLEKRVDPMKPPTTPGPYADPKAAMDMLNEMLADDDTLRVKAAADERSISLVKIKVVEEVI